MDEKFNSILNFYSLIYKRDQRIKEKAAVDKDIMRQDIKDIFFNEGIFVDRRQD